MTDAWDATLYDARHGFVHQLGADLIDLLAPQPGERVLDLGCGTGPLTRQIADAGAVMVGVDASAAMVGQARASYPGLTFEMADATTMAFGRPFDAIFSNAVLHWVRPPEAAAARMFAALRPGGRVVLEMGGRGNVAAVLAAAAAGGADVGRDLAAVLDVNYFPSVGQYAAVLEGAGFEVTTAVLFDRPTPLDGPDGLRQWVRMFRPAVGDDADYLAAVERHARPTLFRDGRWWADYRRLRVRAVRPIGR